MHCYGVVILPDVFHQRWNVVTSLLLFLGGCVPCSLFVFPLPLIPQKIPLWCDHCASLFSGWIVVFCFIFEPTVLSQLPWLSWVRQSKDTFLGFLVGAVFKANFVPKVPLLSSLDRQLWWSQVYRSGAPKVKHKKKLWLLCRMSSLLSGVLEWVKFLE